MNRIWIVGAEGRVGKALEKILNNVSNELLCTDIDEVDVTNEESVKKYAAMYRPNIVINCARISDENECEENHDKAYKVNALGARNLAVQAAKLGAKFVQMSTDDVFAGNSVGNNNEFHVPKPASVYGKSKLAGEIFVREMIPKHFIIRSSWVYGIGKDYVDYVCKKLEKGEKVFANVNQISVPTPAEEIAYFIENIIGTEKYGTYHVVPSGKCTRYKLAKEIARIKGYSEELIVKVDGDPENTLLDPLMTRINDLEVMGEWSDLLKKYLEETGGIN